MQGIADRALVMATQPKLFSEAKALIIDSSAPSRHGMQMALNYLGVTNITQSSRATEAKSQLSQRRYDIILCDYRFDHGITGRQLFLELRQSRSLPLATIFFMITSEATLSKVADVAEFAPDDYLLKPINAVMLEERLIKAKEKKDALAELYESFEKEDYRSIIDVGSGLLALPDFQYRLDVSRIMAQAHLALDQIDAAVAMYDAVLEKKAIPWARIGVNRSDAGISTAKADSALRNFVSESASYLDAYDKLARMRAREGRFGEAYDIYRRALKLTPNHVGRLQVAGQLAFFLGDANEGITLLDRAMERATRTSVLDLRSMLHLALMHLDSGDTDSVEHLAKGLSEARDKAPTDFRTGLLMKLSAICAHLASRRLAKAVQELRQIGLLVIDANTTFELACDVLAVFDRMYARDIHTGLDDWTAQLARRFCVSNQSAALMTDIIRLSPPLADVIRTHSAAIQTLANEGMRRLVAGNAKEAARTLLAHGEDTLNARLLAIACNAAARHAAESADPESAAIAARCHHLIRKVCEDGLHLPQALGERVRQYGSSLHDPAADRTAAVAAVEALAPASSSVAP